MPGERTVVVGGGDELTGGAERTDGAEAAGAVEDRGGGLKWRGLSLRCTFGRERTSVVLRVERSVGTEAEGAGVEFRDESGGRLRR